MKGSCLVRREQQVEQLWIASGRLAFERGGARLLEVCTDKGEQRDRVASTHVVLNVGFEDLVVTTDTNFFEKRIAACLGG